MDRIRNDGQLMDRIRKNVIKLFKEIGFETEFDTNLKIVYCLDVTTLENQTITYCTFILLGTTHTKLSNTYLIQEKKDYLIIVPASKSLIQPN